LRLPFTSVAVAIALGSAHVASRILREGLAVVD
jgi:hypothetical protein